MDFIDLLRGAGIIFFIVALAGVIAYAGDRIGHQVGRKRLTLLNIRPRYTSTIIAVATGMIIALVVTLAAIFATTKSKRHSSGSTRSMRRSPRRKRARPRPRAR